MDFQRPSMDFPRPESARSFDHARREQNHLGLSHHMSFDNSRRDRGWDQGQSYEGGYGNSYGGYDDAKYEVYDQGYDHNYGSHEKENHYSYTHPSSALQHQKQEHEYYEPHTSQPSYPNYFNSHDQVPRHENPPQPINPTSTAEMMTLDRYAGGLGYGYEPGYGLGGSAGTRGVGGKASRKSVRFGMQYGVDLEDVPVFLQRVEV